jgi:hypothetical protein
MGPGNMTQMMYATQQVGLLEAAFDRLLGLEIDGRAMNARGIQDFATQVASSISDHYEELSAVLPHSERENVRRIAKEHGLATRDATIEYLANAYLFRAIRDYFDLPRQDAFQQMDAGGFLAFTCNGSLVASPPRDGARRRTFHYTRMPSRTDITETSSREGELLGDVAVGHRMISSALSTSAVHRLLYVPNGRSDLFEAIRGTMVAASLSVSMFVTRA